MTSQTVTIPEKFRKFATEKYRYRVAYGGRGSGKSWTVAMLLVLRALQTKTRILCAREIQKSINDSVRQLLADTIERLGFSAAFDVQASTIICKNGSRFIFEGLRSNITKIKSLEGIDIAWLEESETITSNSINTLIPTVRKPDSEIWITFNPRYETDDVYERFVASQPPPESLVICANYYDNPWFPDELRKEAEHLQRQNVPLYKHIWEGQLVSLDESSYYAKQIVDEQCTEFEPDTLLPVNTAWDLGMGDATAIWFFQASPGGQVRFVHYYENHGEGLQHYINYLHYYRDTHQLTLGQHIAPHDIQVRELGTGKSRWESASSMGLRFDIAPRLGLEDSIQAARSVLPSCWFDVSDAGVSQGLRHLKRYRKEWDEAKGVYKNKPLHDAASHGADAFRYMATGFKAIANVNASDLMPEWAEDI